MPRFRSSIALLCALQLTLFAQDNLPGNATRSPTITQEKRRFSQVLGNYEAPVVAPVNEGNTARLDSLLRGGNLYLSLEDAIALAIENNIYVEVQRYGPMITDENLLRAKAGGALRTGLPRCRAVHPARRSARPTCS